MLVWRLTLPFEREDDQTVALRGSKSRNKVSVGEPAEGSLEISLLLLETFRTTQGSTAAEVVLLYSKTPYCLSAVGRTTLSPF